MKLFFFLITINFYISFKFNIPQWAIFKYTIVVRIIQTHRLSWYVFFACVMLHTLLVIAWKSVTVINSYCGWSIVCVGTVLACCWGCWFQYQLVSTCTEKRYFTFTTNSPTVIIYPSIFVLSCSIYASDVNMKTKKSIGWYIGCVNGSIFYWFN